jgi:predicted DNA-binding protein with PD1-like motif
MIVKACYVIRLHPGQDLREEIDKFVKANSIGAGCIVTCVGNLKKAIIRMADETVTKTYVGTFEIVSLVGTLESGNSHLHISISDKFGNVFGGHLKMGSIVGITAEIVIGEISDIVFKRILDPQTKFKELVVKKIK